MTKTLTGYDVLVFMEKTSQAMSFKTAKKIIIERITLNDSCRKQSSIQPPSYCIHDVCHVSLTL